MIFLPPPTLAEMRCWEGNCSPLKRMPGPIWPVRPTLYYQPPTTLAHTLRRFTLCTAYNTGGRPPLFLFPFFFSHETCSCFPPLSVPTNISLPTPTTSPKPSLPTSPYPPPQSLPTHPLTSPYPPPILPLPTAQHLSTNPPTSL
jgi:hypothetical protein